MEKKLKLRIISFAYKNGIPQDNNGNGGGFVFDCRMLPNPGKLPEYFELTGKDSDVIDFLKKEPEVSEYIDKVKALLYQAVETYLEKEFESLLICFGCTGGQHRSVFVSETIAELIKNKFPVQVHLEHRELALKTTIELREHGKEVVREGKEKD